MESNFLRTIREAEVDSVVQHMPKGARILEIGAGAGWQTVRLKSHGFEVVGIDIEQVSELSYNYKKERVCDVIIYDGHTIPFADGAFDIVYSSNVLEHISHLNSFEKEINRVLKESGRCIHILPSVAWRFWSIIGYYCVRIRNVFKDTNGNQGSAVQTKVPPFLKRIIIRRHGERGNLVSEFVLFSFHSWRKHFLSTGWKIIDATTGKIFFTGEMLMGEKISISTRKKLSRYLGSYSHIFILQKSDE